MKQKQASPETYIRTRARSLPIDVCYLNKEWKETGMAQILIARKHTNGNFTIGFYLVDTFALGTKDSFYKFNIPDHEFKEILNVFSEKYDPGEGLFMQDYALVHNIIYGANAFAEDNGFKPCKEFALTQYILEEDTEDIELIEIEFGKDGEPFLFL